MLSLRLKKVSSVSRSLQSVLAYRQLSNTDSSLSMTAVVATKREEEEEEENKRKKEEEEEEEISPSQMIIPF